MKRRTLFHCVFAFLLLVAQQGALLHVVWHVHDGQLAQVQATHEHATNGNERTSGQAALCPFDMAFGQVLGAMHGDSMVLVHLAATVERFHDLTAPQLHAEALSPQSRGPPALS
jgi:hypothetical protein